MLINAHLLVILHLAHVNSFIFTCVWRWDLGEHKRMWGCGPCLWAQILKSAAQPRNSTLNLPFSTVSNFPSSSCANIWTKPLNLFIAIYITPSLKRWKDRDPSPPKERRKKERNWEQHHSRVAKVDGMAETKTSSTRIPSFPKYPNNPLASIRTQILAIFLCNKHDSYWACSGSGPQRAVVQICFWK